MLLVIWLELVLTKSLYVEICKFYVINICVLVTFVMFSGEEQQILNA